MVELVEFVAAADMVVADKDLGNRALAGELDHPGTQLGMEVHPDFFQIGYVVARKQLFGANAERTDRARVHGDGYAHFFPFALRPVASGWPAFSHSLMPPRRLNTCSKPSFLSLASAVRERLPLAQQTIKGEFFSLLNSGRRRSSSANGMWRALGIWPWVYSSFSRTSMTVASSRLILLVASIGASALRSIAVRMVSTMTKVPEAVASKTQYQFCCRKSGSNSKLR